MGKGFAPGRWIIFAVVFGCACAAWSQAADSGLPSGALSSTTASGGSAGSPLSGAVDASAGDSAISDATKASVSNTSLSSISSSGLMGGAAGGQGSGKGSSTGIGGSFQISSAAWRGGSEFGGTARGTARSSTKTSAGNPESARMAGAQQLGRGMSASSAQKSAITSALASGKVGTTLGSTNAPAQGLLAQSGNEEESEAPSIGKTSSGAGTYSSDFPDSTKNTGVISPPDASTTSVFTFGASVSHEFPDLTEYEFLRPTLHVGGGSGGEQKKEDLYRRIERRLQEYREADTLKNGLETGKHPSENPFARKPLDSGSSSGLSY